MKKEEIVNLIMNGGKTAEGKGRENLQEWGMEMIENYAKNKCAEQDKNTRHESVEVLTDHVYSWQEKGKKLTDPEFLNTLQNKLMNSNASEPEFD